jgi:hypothetical protein
VIPRPRISGEFRDKGWIRETGCLATWLIPSIANTSCIVPAHGRRYHAYAERFRPADLAQIRRREHSGHEQAHEAEVDQPSSSRRPFAAAVTASGHVRDHFFMGQAAPDEVRHTSEPAFRSARSSSCAGKLQ